MRMTMILLATTLLAACSDKGKPLPPATISMKVVDRSSDARHFRVTLSDGRTPQRITLPRRSRASACPGGPFRLARGKTIPVRVLRRRMSNGTVQMTIDTGWMTARYCPSLIQPKVRQPSW